MMEDFVLEKWMFGDIAAYIAIIIFAWIFAFRLRGHDARFDGQKAVYDYEIRNLWRAVRACEGRLAQIETGLMAENTELRQIVVENEVNRS